MSDLIDRRYLGAIRFLDRATGSSVTLPLQLAAGGVTVFRNRSSLHVIASAPGFDLYRRAFREPAPPDPAPPPVRFDLSDPSGCYLPRSFAVTLPRDPDPEHAGHDDSLFRPVEVRLYRSPRAPLVGNWSAIRATVTRQGIGPAAGALLRVVRGGTVLGSGFTDPRGEVLVAIPGIPVTDFAAGDPDEPTSGPVVVSEVDATVEISFDPAAHWPLDSDDAEAKHATRLRTTRAVTLRTGRTETITVSIAI